MKASIGAALLFAVLFLTPLAAFPAAAERGLPSRDEPIVEHGQTVRFEGGEWVRVRIGDVSLGVIWSTVNDTRGAGLRFFLDYARYFGGAELYDEQGNYLRTTPLPLHTVLIQELGRMVEFHDADQDDRFDLRITNRTTTGDHPIKILNLTNGWFLDGPIDETVANGSASVTFTVSATDVPYSLVYDAGLGRLRPATPADGALDRISFTFHLDATQHEGTATVPFYRVTLSSGDPRTPLRSEFLGNRTMTGRAFNVTGKYDQLIQGWDFAADPDAKLALASSFVFGNYYSSRIVQWLQEQFGGACLRDGSYEQCESDAGPATPEIIARTRLQIAEGWEKAGEMYWTSDVTVDGNPATMSFEIYGGARSTITRDGALFTGFNALGAFVYPQGQTIFHDPGMSASSFYAPIFTATNLTPSVLVGLQLAVVGIALVPALLLRRRGRRKAA
ncbi:MAG TPA: hypothetical protein VGR51_00635 [Thermoplasmata archaeon]|nr:hypothetical protein [Thermoplasmata archaeon]